MMRYSAGASWEERPSLGIGRAFVVAVTYTGAMLGCASLIALTADGLARAAAPLFAMPASAPPAIRISQADGKISQASNAAIIASAEARAGAAKKHQAHKAASGKQPAVVKTAKR